jgi:hypothetical protein
VNYRPTEERVIIIVFFLVADSGTEAAGGNTELKRSQT